MSRGRFVKISRTGVLLVLALVYLSGCDDPSGQSATVGAPAASRSAPIDPPPPAPGTQFEELTAAQIQEAVVQDMSAVTSLRMKGTGDVGGTPTRIDVRLDQAGNCVQWMSGADGTSWTRTDGVTAYLKGDWKFWFRHNDTKEAARRMIDAVGGRWAKYPKGSGRGISPFCQLDQVTGGLFPEGIGVGVTKGEVRTVLGQRAIRIEVRHDDQVDHFWIATEGEHHVLRLRTTGGTDQKSLTLSEYGEKLGDVLPRKGQYVDLSKALG